jgi:hypothetical protein
MAATDDQRWRATADRVELAELMHRYALAIDTAQFDDLREVFTAWFRTVLAPFPDVLHFMSNHVIEAHMSRVDRAG